MKQTSVETYVISGHVTFQQSTRDKAVLVNGAAQKYRFAQLLLPAGKRQLLLDTSHMVARPSTEAEPLHECIEPSA